MDKIDIIIQGGLFNAILHNTKRFINLDFVNRVIISTWEDVNIQDDILEDESVTIIKSSYPSNCGGGNINLQIASSLNGIKAASANLVMKLRSDQQLPDHSLKTLYDFYITHRDDKTLTYLDGTKQKSKICIIGNGTNWPYHPQDHIFWGAKEDMLKLFDIPYKYEPVYGSQPLDGTKDMFSINTYRLRGPIYIGAQYYAKFYDEARLHLNEYPIYLQDGAPKFQEALEFSDKIKETIFIPSPRIEMFWEKYNSGYWYDAYSAQGEYYAN